MGVNPYSFKGQYKAEWQFLQQRLAGRYTSGTRFDPPKPKLRFDPPTIKPMKFNSPVFSQPASPPVRDVPIGGPVAGLPRRSASIESHPKNLRERLISPNYSGKLFPSVDRFFLAIPNAIYWAVVMLAFAVGAAYGGQYSTGAAFLGGFAALILAYFVFLTLYVVIKLVLGLVLTVVTVAMIVGTIMVGAKVFEVARGAGWF
jgi:hypothetical protein